MPTDKAPCPDGFSGGFYKACWDTNKVDVHAALEQFFHMDWRGLPRINNVLIVLILKKQGTTALGDFRSISFLHSLITIFFKVLVMRLAPKLDGMIDQCQSAFIKHRNIQENFLYVQNMAHFFHKSKKPSVLLKPYVGKAFDSVS